MSAIHVDEASGIDADGHGTAEKPYQTMAFALFAHGQTADLLVRKDNTVPYDKPTSSSLKKAVKGAEGLKKKQQKSLENAEREAKEKADAERRLEESKKIVLVEDSSLPKPTKASFIALTYLLMVFV